MSTMNTFRFHTDDTTVDAAHSDNVNQSQHHSLQKCAETALARYFDHLDGEATTNLYQLVLQEVETPLLAAVMKHTRNNQSKASAMLGLNRGTLRKKLKQYDLL